MRLVFNMCVNKTYSIVFHEVVQSAMMSPTQRNEIFKQLISTNAVIGDVMKSYISILSANPTLASVYREVVLSDVGPYG
jgi:hypothetical protein